MQTEKEHLATYILGRAEQHGEQTALRRKERSGKWSGISYGSFCRLIRKTAKGLLELGLKPEDKVGIFSGNRPEWAIADLAVLSCRAVSVPIYATNTQAQAEYIVNDAGLSTVFVGSQEQYDKICAVRAGPAAGRRIVVFDDDVPLRDDDSIHLSGLLETGEQSNRERYWRKDLIITSGGKNVAPQRIESLIGRDHFIEQIVAIGDSRKFISALVVPNFEALAEYAEKQGIGFSSPEELVANPAIIEFYRGRIAERSVELAGYERVKKFTLLPAELSQEGGELTPTLKVKRKAVNDKYADVIDAMYQG